ncbi:uncharacterized protein ATNIH1004_006454 [Aspergillus tanneri]|uniref:Uncharacterized protein n=1 Tax=Aspergillus tanneri TaxID=1220188 RepID=A0A5M9MSA2_9EURO|nr:uncharacterized protein ATNIH1004_006454 [Aspergillus tanneri]KAA8647753.1 hypothetical protein ATNIH1004_006454 [Aspergillus tanneri]
MAPGHPDTEIWVMTVAYAKDLVSASVRRPTCEIGPICRALARRDYPEISLSESPNLVKFSVAESLRGEASKYVVFISVNLGYLSADRALYYVISGILEDESPISISWVSNWNYTEVVPTGPLEGWRGSTALPRVHSLIKVNDVWTVTNAPFQVLSPVMDKRILDKHMGNGETTIIFSDLPSRAISFGVEIREGYCCLLSSPTGQVGLNFTSSSKDYLDGVILITGFF